MASVCRSAVAAGGRAFRSERHVSPKAFLSPKSAPPPSSAFPSSTKPIPSPASRFAMVLGSVETMVPLHSAIASARLRSSLASGPTCWSMLSQGFATPL